MFLWEKRILRAKFAPPPFHLSADYKNIPVFENVKQLSGWIPKYSIRGNFKEATVRPSRARLHSTCLSLNSPDLQVSSLKPKPFRG